FTVPAQAEQSAAARRVVTVDQFIVVVGEVLYAHLEAPARSERRRGAQVYGAVAAQANAADILPRCNTADVDAGAGAVGKIPIGGNRGLARRAPQQRFAGAGV